MNIKITRTLGIYLAKIYTINMLILLCGLLCVIYLFDTVELIRRASKFDDVPLPLVFWMGLLKLPEVGQALLPFAMLFGAMFTFWQLTKRYELITIRSAGFSVWQFLAPLLLVAGIFGALQMMVVNPMGSVFLKKFRELESHHLSRQKNQIAFFSEGLWLREALDDNGYAIIYAPKIEQKNWSLQNPMVLIFSSDNTLQTRYDSESARLMNGAWVFKNVQTYAPAGGYGALETFSLPTSLTTKDVEESFSAPETISFWRLPAHIHILEQAGFNASRMRIYFHGLIAQPLLFAAMILLAASVSMRPPRFSGAGKLFGIGIFFGFVVFFLSSYLQALGASGQIPVILAAWAPAFISFLFGLSALMTLEDG